jgi:putative nucleotidyltransferase with HDIG domain
MSEPNDAEHAEALDRFRRHLLDFQRLPAAPEIITKVIDLTTNANTSTKLLSELVGRDPALSARLLSLANSSFVGAARTVTSIAQAVLLLGFAQVRDIALGVSVWGGLGEAQGITPARRRSLWLHSVTVAAVARRFAERMGHDGATAFAAGLIHDVGKLVLGLRLGDSYWDMLEDADERQLDIVDLEEKTFGCHHGVVGGWLLSMWKLPAPLVEAVAGHHAPADTRKGIGHILGLADAIVVCMTAHLDDETLLASLLRHAPPSVESQELAAVYREAMRERDQLATLLSVQR